MKDRTEFSQEHFSNLSDFSDLSDLSNLSDLFDFFDLSNLSDLFNFSNLSDLSTLFDLSDFHTTILEGGLAVGGEMVIGTLPSGDGKKRQRGLDNI